MAGVGKTTLAAQVFNEINATQQFRPTAWVCMSNDFNLERVTKKILEAVTSIHYPTEDFKQVQQCGSKVPHENIRLERFSFLLCCLFLPAK
ncbi:hypothetical protein L3X38_011171 [Prunus dulcis]|uniref:NB-ARC domain-containing protein n=1 Tax=Prunus dulcis TaxID=3755 RepID=A0AAD4WGW1_PRUDU|nr:hypothetical protein L3X38_011171 [Prunus dulcis]